MKNSVDVAEQNCLASLGVIWSVSTAFDQTYPSEQIDVKYFLADITQGFGDEDKKFSLQICSWLQSAQGLCCSLGGKLFVVIPCWWKIKASVRL